MSIRYQAPDSTGASVTPGAQTNATTASVLGFYGVTGVARPSSYTVGASTATRTVPTTVSTAGQTTVAVLEVQNALNGVIAVLNNLIGDQKLQGLSG